MIIPTKKQFLEYLHSHLNMTGEKPSNFGRRVMKDSGVITRLNKGVDPRLSTMHKINNAIIEETKERLKDVTSD